jgi:hypothetical protein
MSPTPRVGLAMIALLLAAPAAAFQPWTFDAELGAGYDSNPRNASNGEDEAQSLVRAGGGITREVRFTPYTALQLRAALAAEHNLDYDQLSHARLDTRARLLFKPGGGFHVPLVAGWVSLGGRDFGSGIRDSYDYRGGIYVMEPVTTQLAVRLEAMASQRDSASRVFDLRETAFSANVDWALASWLTAYAGYRHGSGDIVVTALGGDVDPKSYHLYLVGPAAAAERDDAYPDDDDDSDDEDDTDDWLAYRLDATTQVITLGFNVPLAPDVALDVQGQNATAELDSGYSYDRTLGAVTLLLRF